MRAEANARSDVHADLIEHMTRKPNRVIPIGDRRPYIKGRARRFDVPAELVEGVGDESVPPRVHIAGRPRLLLSPIQRLDRRPLDGLEDARVDVGFELADQAHEVLAAAHPADAPPG